MQNPICTVLMVSYNHSKYIRKALESVLAQKTEYNFIIKVFDDCSTDGTQEIIKEYCEKYPNLIQAYFPEHNLGAQANILRAYKSVDTKYLAVLECDDYWCNENKLQLQIKALEENPECSFSAHNTRFENEDDIYRKKENHKCMVTNKKIKKINIITLKDLEKLKYNYMNHVSSRVIRTKCITDIENMENVENFLYDNCQFYYLMLQGPMYYINKVMSVYNINTSSTFSGAQINKKIRIHIDNLWQLNKDTNYVIEDLIYRQLLQFNAYWIEIDDNDNLDNLEKLLKSVKAIKHYFIPRFVLDILNIPRTISRFIRRQFTK